MSSVLSNLPLPHAEGARTETREPGFRPSGSVHVLTRPARSPAFTPSNPPRAVTPVPDKGSARLGRQVLGWLQARIASYALGAISIGTVLLIWHLATFYKLDVYVRFGNIPTPGEVLDEILRASQSSRFMTNIGVSLRRVVLGFIAAVGTGVPLGLLVGRYRVARHLAMPVLELFRPIPAIAWVPMAIMLWPSNEVSIVFITFLGAFFPVVLNTIRGVDDVDPVLIRAARSLGAPESQLVAKVVFPAALPHVFTGMALGMGVAWVSLIAAEMISGQFGIGYYTWEAYSLVMYAEIALGMLTIGILGLICSSLIWMLARIAMPWRSDGRNGDRT